jgi:hypothetical protein
MEPTTDIQNNVPQEEKGTQEEKGPRLGRSSFPLAHAPATSESIATKEVRFSLTK